MPVKEKKAKKRKINRVKVGFLVTLVILAGLVFFLKGFILAATVNGKPIFRYAVIRQLEKQSGKDALDSLITESLILQEAQKQGISVLPKEVSEELGRIEERMTAQGQSLDSVLALQGLTRSDLEKQVRVQKMIEGIFRDKIDVSEEEIDKYIEENKDLLSTGQVTDDIRVDVRGQLRQQKLTQEFYPWIQRIKEEAKINYLVSY